RHAAEPGGVANGDGVKPTAATRPTGRRPELAAELPDLLAGCVAQLGRKRSAADAGAVGLADADYGMDPARRHPGAGAHADTAAVAAGNEWIGAVIDVQQCPLSPFEQQVSPLFAGIEQEIGGV